MSSTSDANDSGEQAKPRLSLRSKKSNGETPEPEKTEQPESPPPPPGPSEGSEPPGKPSLKLKRAPGPEPSRATPPATDETGPPAEPSRDTPPTTDETGPPTPAEPDASPQETAAADEHEPVVSEGGGELPVEEPPPEKPEKPVRLRPPETRAPEEEIKADAAPQRAEPAKSPEGGEGVPAGRTAQPAPHRRSLAAIMLGAALIVGIFAAAGYLTLRLLMDDKSGDRPEPAAQAGSIHVHAPAVDEPAVDEPAVDEPAAPPVMAPPPGGDPAVIAFLENLDISMVLEHAERPRIVARQVAYGVGDLIHPGWGLRLAGLDRDRRELHFEVDSGERYVRPY